MISHCANPRCTLPLHYLRGGCLYRFELHRPYAVYRCSECCLQLQVGTRDRLFLAV